MNIKIIIVLVMLAMLDTTQAYSFNVNLTDIITVGGISSINGLSAILVNASGFSGNNTMFAITANGTGNQASPNGLFVNEQYKYVAGLMQNGSTSIESRLDAKNIYLIETVADTISWAGRYTKLNKTSLSIYNYSTDKRLVEIGAGKGDLTLDKFNDGHKGFACFYANGTIYKSSVTCPVT